MEILIFILNCYLLSLYYIGVPILVAYNAKAIYKGICGGNGIPQPNEVFRGLAMLAFWLEVGSFLFLEKPLDLAFMGLLLGVVGISSFAPDKKMAKH